MADGPDGGVVVLPGQSRRIEVGGFDVHILATDVTTEGAFSLIETAEAQLGIGPPLHVHRDAAESFYVLEGEYVMHLDGREFRCPAGSFVHVPVGLPHTFRSTAAPSRKLNLDTPAAMVGYFDDLAAGVREGVDAGGLDAIADRYGMDVVGPVPEGYL